jgi:multiple sugar transport system permease protein
MTERRRAETLWGWLFVIPTITGLLILNIIPIFQSILQSFCRVGDFGRGSVFVGFENYKTLIEDQQVRQAVLNTFAYAAIEVPVSMVLALILAILLNRQLGGRSLFRTIFFLPMVAAPAAVAMVWRWLYNGNFGLFNHALTELSLKPVNWLSDPGGSVGSVAVVGVWACLGYNMVLFLAGLQDIPRDFYEAAEIDGAGALRRHLVITVPLLSPTLYFVAVTRIISALQVFDLIFVMMDRNNPAIPKTQSLVYLFYKYSFVNNNKGYGAAIVLLLLALILIITLIQQQVQKKWVHYG